VTDVISETTLTRSVVDQLSDVQLVGEVGRQLAIPRAAEADSFVLHSALELLARSALMPFVDPFMRPAARDRLRRLGGGFEAFGPPVAAPRAIEFDSIAQGADALVDAIGRGELDDVDAAASWLGRRATPWELREHLADALVPSLAAAGHAPIFLYLLPRVAPRGEVTGELLRQLARELARNPDWRMSWFERRPAESSGATRDELMEALAGTPRLGDPPVAFIHPLMSRIDRDDAAGDWLGRATCGPFVDDLALDDRPLAVLRTAAWSMIAEPTRHAPYGWSHCLTMPQAVLGVAGACADPSIALAIAATYVAGFRTLADGALVTEMETPDPRLTMSEAIADGPTTAAAAAWHRADREPVTIMTALATAAAVHDDAHLVKYTLACLDAAAADPAARRLYLSAAASLAGWWATNDPL
jgi:hypothetical protein